jgi:hypothetical protein
MLYDNLGISGIGRQPAPFEETKENAIPPTPGAGLIAAGRIPGGNFLALFDNFWHFLMISGNFRFFQF